MLPCANHPIKYSLAIGRSTDGSGFVHLSESLALEADSFAR